MLISTKGRYALRLMIDLAEHQADGLIPLREVSERQSISVKYLESIINPLVKAGLVEGVRGKKGGYHLAKTPEDITLLEILTPTEDGLAPVSCLENDAPLCPLSGECKTLPLWKDLNNLVSEFFQERNLASLMNATNPGDYYVI